MITLVPTGAILYRLLIHVLTLQGDATICPILDKHPPRLFIVWPGAVDSDPVSDLRRLLDQPLRFPLIEFGQIRRGRIVQVHDLIPFFMWSLGDDMISAFRGLSVPLDHFILQGFAAKHRRIGGIPAVFVKDLQLIIGLDDDDIGVSVGNRMKKPPAGPAVMRVMEGKKHEGQQASQDQFSEVRHVADLTFLNGSRRGNIFDVDNFNIYQFPSRRPML